MGIMRWLVAACFLLCLGTAIGIGNCREQSVCANAPTSAGATCKCWSTCNVEDGARKCDSANPKWSGYTRTQIGESDVGCSYIPFMSNSRDMCEWEYNPSDQDDPISSVL